MLLMKDKRFISGRLKSFVYAFRGAYKLVVTEHSIMVQFIIAVLVTIAGFIFKISATEWMLQILAIGLVLGVEGLNTAIEKIADFIHPQYNERIGFIKDIAAGAVTFAALAALCVGLIIYIPKIF
ncbi:diacylglycerol kinase family protein [Flavobacterium coralii]|uniref:diacylglycerol kinase family protein n=1 Tax=Flavobacterium coralii TaxID=2838017 RepID=UPI000C5D92DB|nr:diacylglycerol kinase [Flavobacterium sp.]